jgi:hypothetical protein
VNIPVIVVFTKYDLLVMEHLRASRSDGIAQAKQRAREAFIKVTNGLPVPSVSVSTRKGYQGT